MKELARLTKTEKRILTAVSYFPHRNESSIKIVRYFSFELTKDVNFYNGLRFGLYQKVLKPREVVRKHETL